LDINIYVKNIFMEKRKNILLLILLGCIWGSNFLFIRIGVRDIKPMTFTSLRLFIAALVFYMVLKFTGKDLRVPKELIPLLILTGIVDASIPHFLIAWGEQYVESGVTSLILATSPFFTLIIAHFLLQDEKITMLKLFGIGIGFFGVFVLLYNHLTYSSKNLLVGEILILIASIFYALGTIVFILENPAASRLTISACLSVLYVGIVGSVLGYSIFFYLIDKTGATKSSQIGYITPIFATFLGIVFLKESFTINLLIGALLILFGVYIVENSKT
ncbi:MAG: EamA family transporter, partial [Caldisericia bacterium]|nr:EamA family transporter [Caldisericia bacterium]